MGSALLKMGMNRVMIYGSDGLDEASLQGDKLVFVEDGKLRFSNINISDFNLDNIQKTKSLLSPILILMRKF